MQNAQTYKQEHRQRRHKRTRAKVSGTAQRPRISVFKSNRTVLVQAVDDVAGKTLVSISDAKIKTKKTGVPKEFKTWGSKALRAFAAGQSVADGLKKLSIEKAVFDTGGFSYHGRIQAVAEGLRTGGITL